MKNVKTLDTETLDRLFLELSQFTNAKTRRELALEVEIADWREKLAIAEERLKNVMAFSRFSQGVHNAPAAGDFAWALDQLKAGKKVYRTGWQTSMWLALTAQFIGEPKKLLAYFDRTAINPAGTWFADQKDMLANDWQLLDGTDNTASEHIRDCEKMAITAATYADRDRAERMMCAGARPGFHIVELHDRVDTLEQAVEWLKKLAKTT